MVLSTCFLLYLKTGDHDNATPGENTNGSPNNYASFEQSETVKKQKGLSTK